MRRFVFLLPAVFLLATSAPGQDHSQGSSFPVSPSEQTGGSSSAAYSMNLPAWLTPTSAPALCPGSVSTSGGNAEAVPPPQVFGVRPNYPLELYLGYTYLRFYEVPGTAVSTNGFNYSIVYFPKNWIGADGEFVLALGNQYPYQARFLLGLGGLRARWTPFQRNIELWVHGMAGATHYTPQTPYGGQGAFAYEVGGGVDVNLTRVRYAIRAGGDFVGTHYFGTNQSSPKISIGFVYRF